jgi:hypothetical protein
MFEKYTPYSGCVLPTLTLENTFTDKYLEKLLKKSAQFLYETAYMIVPILSYINNYPSAPSRLLKK